jgi:hypothetical protein
MSGKALGRAIRELDMICGRLGVASVGSFYSESNTEEFRKIGEPMPAGMREEPIKWSEPSDGLHTVGALSERHCKDTVEPQVIQDLEDLKRVLLVAAKHGTRFRLRIDI